MTAEHLEDSKLGTVEACSLILLQYFALAVHLVSTRTHKSGFMLTVLMFSKREDRDGGRLTKQVFNCELRDISADVAWLLRLLEAITE